ncbi:MAG: thioredoxin family protein, partial [Candidatus Methylomirabilia bacterium]
MKCQKAKEMAFQVVREAEAELGPVAVFEVDISREPEAVQRYGILSTPSLVIDGRLEFSRVPPARELI